jgi:hypothetical protein
LLNLLNSYRKSNYSGRNDFKWTFFIYRNLKNATKLDNEHLLIKTKKQNYVVVFHEPWLFHVYKGSSCEEIRNLYNIGGQSNKSDCLSFWEKWIGSRIEKFYRKNFYETTEKYSNKTYNKI